MPKIDRAQAEVQKWVESAYVADLTTENVQHALSMLVNGGRSLQTANNRRCAIKSFAKWLHDTHTVREVILRGGTGYNAKEDLRHDRRTVSVDELRRLIEAAERGPMRCGLSGQARSLAYRLAASTGVRSSEIASVGPESFNWALATVTVEAGYTKNGQTATQTLPADLVRDLAAYVATIEAGKPVFPLRQAKGFG
jgi:integrase